MAWLYLLIGGITEIVWATSMKESHGFSRLVPTVITFTFMVISFYCLAVAMRTIPLGTAYVVWTGIGAVGAFLVGIFVFNESASTLRIVAGILIVSGLLLMNLTSKA